VAFIHSKPWNHFLWKNESVNKCSRRISLGRCKSEICKVIAQGLWYHVCSKSKISELFFQASGFEVSQ
jgi:hypothetical protein